MITKAHPTHREEEQACVSHSSATPTSRTKEGQGYMGDPELKYRLEYYGKKTVYLTAYAYAAYVYFIGLAYGIASARAGYAYSEDEAYSYARKYRKWDAEYADYYRAGYRAGYEMSCEPEQGLAYVRKFMEELRSRYGDYAGRSVC